MLETEVKVRLSKREFDKRVKQLWTDSLGEPQFIGELNDFYNVPNGFLRLKRFRDIIKVTFKGPRQDSNEFNSREEIEFDYPLWQYDEIKRFYEALGLKLHFQYTKQRANYFFDDGPIASFDILPNGERYIEIEDSEETIRNVVSLLKLQDFPLEKRSYLEILKDG